MWVEIVLVHPHSFIHSLVRSLVRSFVRSFVSSFISLMYIVTNFGKVFLIAIILTQC